MGTVMGKVFEKMKEKQEAENESVRVILEEKTLRKEAEKKERREKFKRILPTFTFIIFPFVVGAVIITFIVFLFTSSLSFVDYFHVFLKDYSFMGLWSIGYSIISLLGLLYLLSFLIPKPKY
jgi:ABC-type phosphate transport system permease subunit